jgi:hypothetical protein
MTNNLANQEYVVFWFGSSYIGKLWISVLWPKDPASKVLMALQLERSDDCHRDTTRCTKIKIILYVRTCCSIIHVSHN